VLWAAVVDGETDLYPCWRDGQAPVGWPHGYEWTVTPMDGSQGAPRTYPAGPSS